MADRARDIQRRLDELVRPINLSAPSSVKFDAFDREVAGLLSLGPNDVKTVYVSKAGNLDVRFKQPGVFKKRPKLGLALLGKPQDLDSCIPPSQRLVTPGSHIGTIAIAIREPQLGWTVRVIVGPDGDVARRLHQAFPDATQIPAGVGAPPSPPSPAGSATTVPMVVDARVRRMVRLAIASSPAVMLVGPPGTGKTRMLEEVIEEIQDTPKAFGFEDAPRAGWVTPEESWTTRDLVGGETVDDDGHLVFRPGLVLQSIRNDEWLVLDEANRADMDKIFGGLLTWMTGQTVTIGRASSHVDAPPVVLGWRRDPHSAVENVEALTDPDIRDPVRYLAGTNWRLLGTYNALDAQRVFRFGHALGRRFVRIPVPPMPLDDFATALEPYVEGLDALVSELLVSLYAAHLSDRETALGPALFFWMPEYLRKAIELAPIAETGEGDAEPDLFASPWRPTDETLRQLVTEAYLAAAGVWLSKLAPAVLSALGTRVVGSILPVEEWEWMTSLLPSLG